MHRALAATVLAVSAVTLTGVRAAGPAAVTMRDIDGTSWSLLAPAAGQVELLLFIATDCPISNRYAPEIARIAHDYQPRGVRAFLVYPNARTAAADVKTHQRDYGLMTLTAIIDAQHRLVDAVGPKVTPEAAVYSAAGRVYRGRIDDLYADLSHVRPVAQRHDLRLALDAAIAGKTITPAVTDAYGCFIERERP